MPSIGRHAGIQDAHEIVPYGGEIRLSFSQSQLNKAGSMKRNPGDVAVTGKTRNEKAIAKLRADYRSIGA